MARAYVTTDKHRRLRVVKLRVEDSNGRTIVTDNTGYSRKQWQEFIRTGRNLVQAITLLELLGHRTEHTWEELVGQASIDL